ncbi:hypothetical protein GBA63_21340 [Rubrobacter tropicus]|uniref:Uncharacterized protein n=1 Tax=Rubrobacter tropicus TaxID=2653851 RepID=A0A6G8QEM9_9ACTN|nr:hypothetical protein [Rubrobacter tropicus]QIN84903.1 hypothetical protein GBA63_21340 [Rubrobacter tropicus]
MTEEAGAITGELELLCWPENDGLHVAARYAETDDWYTVSGGPVRLTGDLEGVSEQVAQHLRTPGPVVDGNEKAVSLEGFAGA